MEKLKKFKGTIKAAEKPNLLGQARLLREAMQGAGTDERCIIRVLASHSNQQRQDIAKSYHEMYGSSLADDLKAELSGCFEDAVLALIETPAKFDVFHLHKAVEGQGTDEKLLMEIICAQTNDAIKKLTDQYLTSYSTNPIDVMEKEVSGDFKQILIAQLRGNREEEKDNKVDMEKVKKDAKDLFEAGENKLGTDESTFNKILTLRSFAHLRCVFEEYKSVAKTDIEESIKSETSGNYQDALLAIVKFTVNRPAYIAERLFETLDGPGTDDEQLIRLIVSHCETDLADVKEEYFKLYERSLRSMVEDDTSGDYKKLLCALIDGKLTPQNSDK